MERHTFAMKVKKGQMDEYRKRLGGIWPELTAFLDRNQVRNFSIWNAEDLIFGYYETGDERTLSMEEETEKEKLTGKMEDTFNWISVPGEPMRLMYHDFGIVRESKELIRHRMFMTRLKPGCEEEYKRRHDGLVEKRGGTVTQGPDSNFSSGVRAGTFLDMTRLIRPWRRNPPRQTGHLLWNGKRASLRSWTGSPTTWTG